MVLSEKPEKQGESGKRWNGMNLSRYIGQRYGVVLNVRSCQLLLRGPDVQGYEPKRHD
jgi:hypothetical protein